jgi:multimeric flavodoxin WrbA
MYAVAVNGSPRKGGNTELLLKEVLGERQQSGWDTELVKIGGTPIRGCIAWLGRAVAPVRGEYPKG